MHSPLNCLPGAGWEPVKRSRVPITVRTDPDPGAPVQTVTMNRIVIQKGLDRQVVLYWYQSHGRVVASEYWGKIYTVLDAIRLNRTDAAMVRVMSAVPDRDDEGLRAGGSRGVRLRPGNVPAPVTLHPRVEAHPMRRAFLSLHASRLLLVALSAGACSKSAQQYFDSGNSYYAQQKYKEAVVEYRNVIQKEPRHGEARLKLAECYEKLGDVRGAYSEYVRAADLLPGNASVQLKAGAYLLRARKFEDASARADAVLKMDPRNVDALILQGEAKAGLQKLDEAVQQMKDAIEIDPKAPTVVHRAGPVPGDEGRHGGRGAGLQAGGGGGAEGRRSAPGPWQLPRPDQPPGRRRSGVQGRLRHRPEERGREPGAGALLHVLQPAGRGRAVPEVGRRHHQGSQREPLPGRLLHLDGPAARGRRAPAEAGRHDPGLLAGEDPPGGHPVRRGEEGRRAQDRGRGPGQERQGRCGAGGEGPVPAAGEQGGRGAQAGRGSRGRQPAVGERAVHPRARSTRRKARPSWPSRPTPRS